jgi:hypothetical protein
MNCPKCNSENIVTVGELYRCQSCEEYFKAVPETYSPQEKAAAAEIHQKLMEQTLPGSVPKDDFMRERNLALVRGHIKNRADRFAIAGILAGVFSCIVLLFAIFHSIAGDDAVGMYACAGSLLALAFWLYLIAQIIHIRANTEK